ncbi:MAG: GNAT family N-acetyltransferase [Rhodospirillales bacterium]|nr:GNAT family N-acetyltransferase [Rhodospirillales bacterium]
MSAAVQLRPARPEDAGLLGEMLVEAGGGIFEVLLEGLVPGLTPAQMMAEAARREAGGFSFRHATVVEVDGIAAGSLTAFPAGLFGSETSELIPPDRLVYLAPMQQMLDRGSWYIAALAIRSEHRRRHLGGRLLRASFAAAREQGFPRISLHVWAKNVTALGLYLCLGFDETGSARVPEHPLLRHGTTLLALSRPA